MLEEAKGSASELHTLCFCLRCELEAICTPRTRKYCTVNLSSMDITGNQDFVAHEEGGGVAGGRRD